MTMSSGSRSRRVRFLSDRWLRRGAEEIRFSHAPGAADFGRVTSGQVHVFDSHQYGLDAQLGDVLRAWTSEGYSYAEVALYDPEAFSGDHSDTQAKAVALLNDYGHRGLSAGVAILSSHMAGVSRDGKPRREATAWELVEISMTGIPADDSSDAQYNGDSAPEIIQMHIVDGGQQMDDTTLTDLMEQLGPTIRDAMREALGDGAPTPIDAGIRERLEALEKRDATLSDGIARLIEREEGRIDPGGGGDGAEDDGAEDDGAEDDGAEDAMAMARMALSMPESYPADQVHRLAGEIALGDISADIARERLAAMLIERPRRAAQPAQPESYDIGRMITAVITGDHELAPYEMHRSREITRRSEIAPLRRGRYAIPREEIDAQLGPLLAQAGSMGGDIVTLAAQVGDLTSGVGPGVDTSTALSYRADVPDPFDVVPLLTRLPAGPGNPKFVAITTPEPAAVPEPGNSGYAATGDVSATAASINPTLLVVKTALTRLAEIQLPQLMSVATAILLARMDEVRTDLILFAADDSNAPSSIYETSGVSSSAELTAAPTLAELDAALDNSWQFEGKTRSVIVHPDVRASWWNIAQPAGVAALSEGDTIRNRPRVVVRTTKRMGARKYRGLVGDLSLYHWKEWDGAIYISMREEEGIEWLALDSFWNGWLQYPSSMYRFVDDA